MEVDDIEFVFDLGRHAHWGKSELWTKKIEDGSFSRPVGKQGTHCPRDTSFKNKRSGTHHCTIILKDSKEC